MIARAKSTGPGSVTSPTLTLHPGRDLAQPVSILVADPMPGQTNPTRVVVIHDCGFWRYHATSLVPTYGSAVLFNLGS